MSIGHNEMSIGHTEMSIRPSDKQKCPLDIQMSIRPLDEQKCPLDTEMSIGHFAEVLDINQTLNTLQTLVICTSVKTSNESFFSSGWTVQATISHSIFSSA